MSKIKLYVFLFFINFNCFSQSLSECIKSAVESESIGEYEISLKSWDKSIEIDTTDCGWLYYRRSEVKWRMNDLKGAIEDNLYAIDRNLNCDLNLSDDFDVGYGEGAIDMPSKRSLLFEVAKYQIRIEDYSNAMLNLNKVINDKTEFIELWNVFMERGHLKSLLNDYRGAISDFDLALKYNPKATIIYSYRGYSKLKLKDYLGSINDYTKAIQVNPNDSPNAYYNRGLARIYSKQIELGCKDLSKAGEQGDLDAYEIIKEYCQ